MVELYYSGEHDGGIAVTISELEQLQSLRSLIERERERVKKLRAAAGIKSPSLSGIPHTGGVHDRISENIPDAVDLDAEISKQLEELEERRNKIETWINQQPVKIRLIATLRYIDGLSWNETADEIYKNSANPKSENAVRMYFKRHLKREKERGNVND